MGKFSGFRVETVDSFSIGAYPDAVGAGFLVKTECCGVAESFRHSYVAVYVCGHLALADAYQTVTNTSGPDVTVMIRMDTLDGM